ncbi:MAG: hypothetical protein ACP5N9_03570 [Candidatus Bilamarchaeum sp.]
MEIPNIYKGNYKLLAIVPLLLIITSIILIINPGIKLGVDFQGGTLLTLATKEKVDGQQLEAKLNEEGLEAKVKSFDTASGQKLEIEIAQSERIVKAEDLKTKFNNLLPEVTSLELTASQSTEKLTAYNQKKAELEGIADEMFSLTSTMRRNSLNITTLNQLQKKFGEAYSLVYGEYRDGISKNINKFVRYDSISIQSVSPVLSTKFIEKALNVVIFSAVLSVALVFMFFRKIVPSLAVLTGSLADVLIAMGGMVLLHIPLTLNSFAALLMLIGFSLDTDILLTTRLVKRKGDPRQNAFDAMKTGMTMSIMAMVAFGTLFALSLVTHISTYYEIAAVALIGLFGDIFATWGINAVMVLNHVEKKGEA